MEITMGTNTLLVLDQIEKDVSTDLEKILKLRRNILSFFDKTKLTDALIEIISASSIISFSSSRALNFINKERPVFSLHLDIAAANEKYGAMDEDDISPKNVEKVVDHRINVLYNELIRNFTEVMRSAVKDTIATNENFKEYIRDQNLMDGNKNTTELEFLISNLFDVRVQTDGLLSETVNLCQIQQVNL
jgi:aminopeptidase C